MRLVREDAIDFEQYMQGDSEAAYVLPAGNWLQEVLSRFRDGAHVWGARLPWAVVRDYVRVRPREVSIWAGINGHGKALCLDTPIPTPDGWRRFGDLKPGDRVFDESGHPCNIVAETPVQIGRPCYRVTFSDGSEIIADEQHEWLTDTVLSRASARNAKRPRTGDGRDQSHKRTLPAVVTTGEIAATLRPSSGCRAHLLNHSIRTCGALEYEAKDLPIDPYLLGAWLGDGSSNNAGMTSADYGVIEHFVEAGFTAVKGPRYRYGITGGFQAQLRANNLLNNKHVPEIYLRGSVEQRMALLQGLMDTDGHVTSYGRCEFTSMNRNLADAVLELVLSLGVQARMLTGRATLYGKDCGEKYRVTFTPDFQAFRLARKARNLRPSISERAKHRFIAACDPVPSVPVKCIQVDSESHLFLAGSSMIPTHNSQIVGQVVLGLMAQGERVCIASLEMRPEATMYRMTRQALGRDAPTRERIEAFHTWADNDRLWLYDQQGTVKSDRIIALGRYVSQKLGCTQLVVDSLMKCGIGVDDYNRQKAFIDELCAMAKDTGLHVHLVAHSRKGRSEDDRIGKFDIKGASEITDQADNVFTVWRNKPKERATAQGDHSMAGDPDCVLSCDKQRHGEWEGLVKLWFHRQSMQYTLRDVLPVGYEEMGD